MYVGLSDYVYVINLYVCLPIYLLPVCLWCVAEWVSGLVGVAEWVSGLVGVGTGVQDLSRHNIYVNARHGELFVFRNNISLSLSVSVCLSVCLSMCLSLCMARAKGFQCTKER